jgi:hypothetical protein
MNMEMLASYGRSLLATCLGAMLALGKLPYEFTVQDWTAVANAVWVACIPVLIRALNPNDHAFGFGKDVAE